VPAVVEGLGGSAAAMPDGVPAARCSETPPAAAERDEKTVGERATNPASARQTHGRQRCGRVWLGKSK